MCGRFSFRAVRKGFPGCRNEKGPRPGRVSAPQRFTPDSPEVPMLTAVATETPTSVKARKRPSVKASARQSVPKAKCTILLSAEADQRLAIHAAMLGVDRSSLVEKLISEHLRRFVVSDRGGLHNGVIDETAGAA